MTGLTELDGKVAVVTGGASGIGFGIARQLTGQGMKVVIADIEQGALDRAARELGALPVRTDVSDPESVENLAARALAEFGAVHVVCNNAGVGSVATIAEATLADWRWMIDVNLYGVIHGTTTFLPILKRNAAGGHFVNTSSLGGLATMPTLGLYSVTKFGVVALSEVLAQELAAEGSKVGVTVLCPGTVSTNIKASKRNRPAELGSGGLQDVDLESTEFGALTRWASPEEVGDVVVNAIRRGDMYAFTHPEMKQPILDRQASIEQAFERAHAELGF